MNHLLVGLRDALGFQSTRFSLSYFISPCVRFATMPSQKAMRSSCSSGGGNGTTLSSIARQPSIYGFSAGELQKSAGKSFGMEDFGKNVWIEEEGGKATAHAAMDPASNFSLLRTVSGKSMEEIWKQIQPRNRVIYNKQQNTEQQQQQQQRRLGTMGEMTLEDFLLEAGVVKDDNDAKVDLSLHPGNPNLHPAVLQASDVQADWMMNNASQQQHQHVLQQAEAGSALEREANLMLPGHLDGAGSGPGGLALVPSVSDCPTLSRKRGAAPHVVEESMQRRQKRMIKNRESAARSRARRQAYTVELEAEVTQLKEENARLKKLQVLENRAPKTIHNQALSNRVLRRTQSW